MFKNKLAVILRGATNASPPISPELARQFDIVPAMKALHGCSLWIAPRLRPRLHIAGGTPFSGFGFSRRYTFGPRLAQSPYPSLVGLLVGIAHFLPFTLCERRKAEKLLPAPWPKCVARAGKSLQLRAMEDLANIQDVYLVSFPLSPSELEWLKQQSLRVAEEFKRFRARQIEPIDAAGNDPPK